MQSYNTKAQSTNKSQVQHGETQENAGGCRGETRGNTCEDGTIRRRQEGAQRLQSHNNVGMMFRWSEAGKGQVRDRKRKTRD